MILKNLESDLRPAQKLEGIIGKNRKEEIKVARFL
jgi:hypothetical protein